jgi:hypothetical protein
MLLGWLTQVRSKGARTGGGLLTVEATTGGTEIVLTWASAGMTSLAFATPGVDVAALAVGSGVHPSPRAADSPRAARRHGAARRDRRTRVSGPFDVTLFMI